MSEEGQVNRKEFLKLAALAPLPFVAPEKRGGERFRDNLEAAGLLAFQEANEAALPFTDRFVRPPVVFREVYDLLSSVSFGELNADSPEVVEFKNAWGGKVNEAKELALLKADSFEIDSGGVKVGDTLRLKSLLGRFSVNFSPMTLALPNKVNIVDHWGYANSRVVALDAPDSSEDEDVERSGWILLHEATHRVEGGWSKIKEYVDMNDFAKYVGDYIAGVTKVADYLIKNDDLSIEEIMQHHWAWFPEGKSGGLMARRYEGFLDFSSFARAVLGIEKHNASGEVVVSPLMNIKKEWLNLALNAARTLDKIGDSKKKREYFDKNSFLFESLLWNGIEVEDGKGGVIHLEGFFSGIGHHLVGPAESVRGQLTLPRSRDEMKNTKINRAILRLQQSRLSAFSNIIPDRDFSELQVVRSGLVE